MTSRPLSPRARRAKREKNRDDPIERIFARFSYKEPLLVQLRVLRMYERFPHWWV